VINEEMLKQEIERLEKENAELKKSYARNIEAMTGQISNDLLSVIKKYPTALPYICELRKEIERFEKELQVTREQLSKAEQRIFHAPHCITNYERKDCDCGYEQYFKQKDEVKCDF
jgi:DNA repair ATPase RecN